MWKVTPVTSCDRSHSKSKHSEEPQEAPPRQRAAGEERRGRGQHGKGFPWPQSDCLMCANITRSKNTKPHILLVPSMWVTDIKSVLFIFFLGSVRTGLCLRGCGAVHRPGVPSLRHHLANPLLMLKYWRALAAMCLYPRTLRRQWGGLQWSLLRRVARDDKQNPATMP